MSEREQQKQIEYYSGEELLSLAKQAQEEGKGYSLQILGWVTRWGQIHDELLPFKSEDIERVRGLLVSVGIKPDRVGPESFYQETYEPKLPS